MYKETLDNLQKIMTVIGSSLDSLFDERTALENSILEKKQTNDSLDENIETKRSNLKELEATIFQSQSRLSNIHDEIESKTYQLRDDTKKLNELEFNINNLVRQSKDELEVMKTDREKLAGEVFPTINELEKREKAIAQRENDFQIVLERLHVRAKELGVNFTL